MVNERFFFELLPELTKASNVRLTILRLNEQAIAWQLDLLGKNYLAVHHLSFDEKWKKYSPGRQLLRHNLEMAWKERRTIDFLPLAFDYKQKLATEREEVHELHWFKRSIRGWIACHLIRWNMKLRQKMRDRKSSFQARIILLVRHYGENPFDSGFAVSLETSKID